MPPRPGRYAGGVPTPGGITRARVPAGLAPAADRGARARAAGAVLAQASAPGRGTLRARAPARRLEAAPEPARAPGRDAAGPGLRTTGKAAACIAAILCLQATCAVAGGRAPGSLSGVEESRPTVPAMTAGSGRPQASSGTASVPIVQSSAGRSVSVFRSLGRRQCESGGETAASLAAVLKAAGIAVRSAGCGDSGQAVIAVCGAGTTEIGIFEVSADDAARATALGFRPLRELPDARSTACPRAR